MKIMNMSPQQFADAWKNGVTTNVQKTKDGVSRVTESPMDKAAARADAYVAGVTAAAQSGKWQAGLRQVTLADWKANTMAKIGERMTGGATQAMPKMVRFGAWLAPAVNAASQSIDNMPKQTLEDNIQRMTAFVRAMAANRYKA